MKIFLEITELTISQAHKMLEKKEISAMELLRAFWTRIEEKEPEIRAYLSLAKDLAESQAKKTDWKLMKGKGVGILEGIPAAIKDAILVEGEKCTAGSKILGNYIAPYDATVISKLKKAGAVILGKTNLDEFAMGSSTENSGFWPTRNPHDLERVPGGSSGGSAAAVAANECVYALGSDTGGSIRQPASFCGVVGLKPTYGAVSRYGLIAMASSLDQIGPIIKTVEDAMIVFEAIKGEDRLDSTSVASKSKIQMSNVKSNQKSKIQIKKLRIGIPKEYYGEGLDQDVEKMVKKAVSGLEKEGAKVEEVSLPHTEYALACYYIIMPSEVSANLARYDGIKYGASKAREPESQEIKNLFDVYFKTRQEYLGREVRRRIMLGTYALSAGYYDAYYLKAQRVRTLIKKDFENVFQDVDLIIAPTSPILPFKFGEKTASPLSMYLADVYTVPVNLAGLPALSLPCGKVGHLPVGLQIIGPWWGEETILDLAGIVESFRDKK